MSTEQSESAPAVTAHTQGETQATPAVDVTQQATTPTATTSTQRVKNPKRVAAGKMVTERTRLAREQQKKAAEAYMASNKAKATTAAPEPPPTTEGESPKYSGEKNIGLSTTQWLAVGSIVVSLVGIYYKREELKAAFDKKTPEPAPEPACVEPEPARATQPKGFKKMIKLSCVKYITMPKVDVPQILISSAAIFGIGIIWYDFNKKVYERVLHLSKIMLCETAEEKARRIKEIRRKEEEIRRIKEEKEEED